MSKIFSNFRLPFIPSTKAVEDSALDVSKNRLAVVLVVVTFAFAVLLFRLFELSITSQEDFKNVARSNKSGIDFFQQRASVTDRQGVIIATNLSTASLYANPSEIIDPKLTAQIVCKTFSSLNCGDVLKKLQSKKTFIWIKRHLTPKEQQNVNDLGIPGLYFIKEEKRVYPHNSLYSHIIGFVDVDGKGLAGVEQYFNSSLVNESGNPLELSVDTRVQEILHNELQEQVQLHSAIGASGAVMDVNTGEIVAMVSLPDFDPNKPNKTSERARFNQITLGTYEMGSTFKVFTTSSGLDGNFIKVNDAFNTDASVMVGNYKIKDFKPKGGVLSVPEILMYSSNIGTAQIAMKIGVKKQQEYMKKFGLLSGIEIELPEKSYPLYPSLKNWGHPSLVTISYGHGIAVTPLHVLKAFSAIVNGGKLVKPTLLKVADSADVPHEIILKDDTSKTMRKLMRLVVTKGSGKKANAEGYVVAGKTGTAEKLNGGKYSKNSNLALFVCAFPIDDPKYALFIAIDEAKKNSLNGGYTMGGVLAAPVAGNVITRIAPILGVSPRNEADLEIQDKTSLVFQARYKAGVKN